MSDENNPYSTPLGVEPGPSVLSVIWECILCALIFIVGIVFLPVTMVFFKPKDQRSLIWPVWEFVSGGVQWWFFYCVALHLYYGYTHQLTFEHPIVGLSTEFCILVIVVCLLDVLDIVRKR